MSRGFPEIDQEKCKGCALCVGACPEKILAMSREQFNRQGFPFAVCFDTERCTACLSCGIMCPDTAIKVLRYATAGAGE